MTDAHDWDRRYATAERLFVGDPDDALVEFVEGLPPGQAVDLGAGEGRNALWLARRGWEVTAVDFSAVALDRLRSTANENHLAVEAVVSDVVEYLANGSTFDLVVVSYMHPDSLGRSVLLSAAASAVRPGGHLFLVGHHLESLGNAGPPDPERLYTLDRIEGAFPGLTALVVERRERRRTDLPAPSVDVVAWLERAVD